jgi:hypothetical protein
MWQQREVFDGTYRVSDLLTAHALLDIREKSRLDVMDQARSKKPLLSLPLSWFSRWG